MAVRTDVTVDWLSSPRVATVAAPSVELSVQDLHDTLRTEEAHIWNIEKPPLVSSAGKESLGGNAFVGITTTLLNTRIAFQARAGPAWTACIVYGGNVVAVNDIGQPMNPIHATAYVQVSLAQSTSPSLINDLSAAEVIAALRVAEFDGVSFDEVLADLLSHASGKIIKIADGVFEYKARNNTTKRFRFQVSETVRERV